MGFSVIRGEIEAGLSGQHWPRELPHFHTLREDAKSCFKPFNPAARVTVIWCRVTSTPFPSQSGHVLRKCAANDQGAALTGLSDAVNG